MPARSSSLGARLVEITRLVDDWFAGKRFLYPTYSLPRLWQDDVGLRALISFMATPGVLRDLAVALVTCAVEFLKAVQRIRPKQGGGDVRTS